VIKFVDPDTRGMLWFRKLNGVLINLEIEEKTDGKEPQVPGELNEGGSHIQAMSSKEEGTKHMR